jgi:uncharacterized protein (DUF1330 family)
VIDEANLMDATAPIRLPFAGFYFTEEFMAKGYWITFYRSAPNPAALAEYARMGTIAIQGAGGRFVARGPAVKAFESGLSQRSVVIEFESVEKAISAYEGPAYQEALKALGPVERDVRIIEGV